MSSLKSAAPPVASKREFDPEIKDMASYIHNTPIESELAVRSIGT
jgi:2-methylcitrate dehydratase